MREHPLDDPDEVLPRRATPEDEPLPPRRDVATERLVDLVESAFYYLRRHRAPEGASEAERQALLDHMERVLAETTGWPRGLRARPGGRPWSVVERRVAQLVAELDDGRGAAWEAIESAAARERIAGGAVEAALNALLEAGVIYEPVLGRMRRA